MQNDKKLTLVKCIITASDMFAEVNRACSGQMHHQQKWHICRGKQTVVKTYVNRLNKKKNTWDIRLHGMQIWHTVISYTQSYRCHTFFTRSDFQLKVTICWVQSGCIYIYIYIYMYICIYMYVYACICSQKSFLTWSKHSHISNRRLRLYIYAHICSACSWVHNLLPNSTTET